MYASSSSVNPTPLAHADTQRDVHSRENITDPMYHLKEHLVSWKKKLEFAASNVACNTMKEAALEIRSNETDTEFSQCGVSVDGTWQRRGYSSLNGCVSVISIDSGKVLDVEFMSKVCRLCNSKTKR
ncbi:uncharacterized protein TNCV_4900661 [Trichonephila clavipes]|nr:uncharacterized protein TNCV_4900661 [Trichonephila clavipes]